MAEVGERGEPARRPPAWAEITVYAAVAGAHVATIALARAIARTTTEGVPLWAAAGVTLAALVLSPRRWWSGILVATVASNLVANLVIDVVPVTAVVSAVANAAEPALGAWLTLRFCGGRPRLDERRHLLTYLLGAAVAGPVLGAAVGVLSVSFTPDHLPLLDVAPRWFVGDALGVLVVGTLLIAWLRPAVVPRISLGLGTEVLAAAGVVVAASLVAFWGSSPVLAYVVIPPLGWAAIRFGVRGAATGGVVVAVIADWATIEGRGLFAFLGSAQNNEALWSLQLFLAVVLVTALVLSAHVGELGRTETALAASEERRRFGSLLESSPDPILVLRADGTVAHLNEQVLALTGMARAAVVDRPWIDRLPAAARANAKAVLDEVLAKPVGSRTIFEMAGLGQLLDRRLEAAGSPLDTVEGRVLVLTIRDVTEREAAEARLREAVEAAEAATTAKTQFLATMSHEIRTPMSAVTSLIELLDHTALDAEQQSLLATMRSSSAALLRIIDDTLDFSKIEAGMLEFESVPVSIADEVRAIASLLEPAAATKGIALRTRTEPDEPPALLGDPVRIRQVLINLVGNAIKFTSTGGVDLDAVVAAGRAVTFTVRDTGIGIEPERLDALFRPFTQAEHSTTRLYGGTGLGLSIVSRIVELMGGSIEVDSAPGAGSTFRVTLPLPEAPAGVVAPARRSRPKDGVVDHDRIGGHVVLVAEDNPVNRDVLRRQLAFIGCACEVAADGQEALDALARGGSSLLLTDCHMPVLDGFALARSIRGAEQRGERAGRLPIVAVTANAMDGDGDRCLAAGMDAYLTKPVDLARLAVLLADLLPDEPVRDQVPIDLSVLRQIVGDDDAALLDVLGTCAGSLAEQAASVVAGLEAGDRPSVGAAAHRIAGAAASVGAGRLATLARALELGAASGGDAALLSLVDWTRREVDVVVAEVSNLEARRG